MPSDLSQKIRGRLARARTNLLSEVEGLDGPSWDWRPGDGRWSARLTLAHVAAAQWDHLHVARSLASGESVDIPGFDLDTWNAASVRERRDWTVNQIRDDLDRGQREAFSFLRELDDASLAITGSHPALGHVSVSQVLRIIALHDEMHRRDIAKLKAEWAGSE